MDREERIRTINTLCREAGCDEKLRKIHFGQYVDRGWHTHPADDFCDWWESHKDGPRGNGIKTKIAWNVQAYRDEFMEAKQYGVVSAS